jgi:uncharacterized protein with WD repeat
MDSGSITEKTIVVDNLPAGIGSKEKQDKLTKALGVFISTTIDVPVSDFTVHLVNDKNNSSAIGAFVTFTKSSDAKKGLSMLNRVAFDKTSIFSTFRWKEMREELPAYESPEFESEKNLGITNPAMEDPMARPMLLLRHGNFHDTELHWIDRLKGKLELYKKPMSDRNDNLGLMTEWNRKDDKHTGLVVGGANVSKPLPVWSPLGTMLISQHPAGIRFWSAAAPFHLLYEIPLAHIRAFQVSPLETFVAIKRDKDLSIWNVKECKLLRIHGGFDIDAGWPIAKFSADEQHVVMRYGTQVRLYKTATMELVPGSYNVRPYTVDIPNLQDVDWSPSNPKQLAFVCSGDQHSGWRVTIDELVIRDNVASFTNVIRRNFMKVAKVQLLWHPEGTGLAAKITKTDNITEYCLFRIQRNSISGDIFKIEPEFQPARFAWQNGGKYFAITLISSVVTGLGAAKMEVRFYSVDGKGLSLVGKFATIATSIHWAPKGNRCVAANYEKSILEFYSINAAGFAVQQERVEFPLISDSQWDPSGRFFAVWTSYHKSNDNNKYRIYDMNGVKVVEAKTEKLSHISWRPLLPTLLDNATVEQVQKNLKEIAKKYEEDDKKKEADLAEAERLRREKAEHDYVTRMKAIAAFHQQKGYMETRAELRASAPSLVKLNKVLAAMPEGERTVTETCTESRIKERREVRE